MPDHLPGQFQNCGTPNEIRAQTYVYRLAAAPRVQERPTRMRRQSLGIALNGVPLDPGAAEWLRGVRSESWQYEPLSGAIALGLDESHAHVQPTGAYHYHGPPMALLVDLGLRHQSDGEQLSASHGGPPRRERYAGTFAGDYVYTAGAGDLDECNGRFCVTPDFLNGTYAYFLTESRPVIPRQFRGTPAADFATRRSITEQPCARVRGVRRRTHCASSRRRPPSKAECHDRATNRRR